MAAEEVGSYLVLVARNRLSLPSLSFVLSLEINKAQKKLVLFPKNQFWSVRFSSLKASPLTGAKP